MNQNQAKTICEQIQEDILSYASTVDDEKLFFTDEVLDELCNIVIDNFMREINVY